jgi:hypothetical protein
MTELKTLDGWRFYCADFSMIHAPGYVMFMRDTEQTVLWHEIPDDVKDSDDCPPLYIKGFGDTFIEAYEDAYKKVSKIPKLFP